MSWFIIIHYNCLKWTTRTLISLCNVKEVGSAGHKNILHTLYYVRDHFARWGFTSNFIECHINYSWIFFLPLFLGRPSSTKLSNTFTATNSTEIGSFKTNPNLLFKNSWPQLFNMINALTIIHNYITERNKICSIYSI